MASLYITVSLFIYTFGLSAHRPRKDPLLVHIVVVLAPIKGTIRPCVDGSSVRVIYTGLTLLRAQSLIFDIYSVHGSGAPVFIGPGKAVTSARCSYTNANGVSRHTRVFVVVA